MPLPQEYHAHGIRFRYPQGWELTEETREDALTITVADAGPFWSVTILRGRPRAERVLDEAVTAFEQEYSELDQYPSEGVLGGLKAQIRNLEFVALELINSVFLTAAEAGGKTLFVMAQVTDHERDYYEDLFRQMNDSLQLDDDAEILIH